MNKKQVFKRRNTVGSVSGLRLSLIKIKFISFLLSLSFVIAIAYVSLIAPIGKSHNFLIAVPKISGSGIPIKKLEGVNESNVILTYENIYDKSVKALRSNYSVVLKGTNEAYPHVMNYSVTSGGYFNSEAFDNKNKVAVLNEKAAFEMFGTLSAVDNDIQIDMTPYIVIGVIKDMDTDNMNIFIPATCMAESVGTVMINLSYGSGLTEEYVKNELKHIGIDEMKYDYINIGLILLVIKNNTLAALKIALLGLLLIVVKKAVKSIGVNIKEFERQRQEYYFKELLIVEIRPLQKLAFSIVAAGGSIISCFIVILNLFESFLCWSSLRRAFDNVKFISFYLSVSEMEKLFLLSNTLLIGFIIVFVFFITAIWD